MSDVNKDFCAFHRSPTILESVTPDHSPIFVDELNALRALTAESDATSSASSSTSETENIRSMWCNGVVSRPDLISGRLEFNSSNINDSDILKILPHNKKFLLPLNNVSLSRVMTPFTPITAITPEPENASDDEMEGFDKKFFEF